MNRPEWLSEEWVTDGRDVYEDEPLTFILELKNVSVTPGPCVNVWIFPDGRYVVEFMKHSDLESSGDKTLYDGKDEQVARAWASVAETAKAAMNAPSPKAARNLRGAARELWMLTRGRG